jgi:hypothetical protein
MTASPTPTSVAITGNRRIAFVPTSVVDPKVATALAGATVKDITYSLTPSGFRPAITENSISDGRMAQRQILNGRGNFSETLEVQYVYGSAADIAQAALAEGVLGYIVDRDSVDNALDWTAAQKVDIYTIEAGKQRKDPPAENALQTITQTLYIKATTQRSVALT